MPVLAMTVVAALCEQRTDVVFKKLYLLRWGSRSAWAVHADGENDEQSDYAEPGQAVARAHGYQKRGLMNIRAGWS